MIPYGRQDINDDDIKAVVEVLHSDWLTCGPMGNRFEKAVSQYCSTQYGIAVSSATAALHLACLTLGVKRDDWVWTSPNTFVASANCALYCGANVDFVDIDPITYNMSVIALSSKLAEAKKNHKLPRVVIPVHFAGQSCDMRAIKELANQYGFYIVEDACHAIGGEYSDAKIGSCAYSDMTVFSFHPVKIITTGEGGMIMTNQKKLQDKLRLLLSHGITKNPDLMHNKNQSDWYYDQLDLGYNYRITDIQCALGLSQMQRLDEFVARRRCLAARYNKKLCDLPLVLPCESDYSCSSYHLYVVRLQLDKIKKDRKQVFDELRNAGIEAHVHYIPVYTQPFYRALGLEFGACYEAEKYYQEALTLPLYYGLSEQDQNYIVKTLGEIL